MKWTKIEQLGKKVAVEIVEKKDINPPRDCRVATDWELLCVLRNNEEIKKLTDYWWYINNIGNICASWVDVYRFDSWFDTDVEDISHDKDELLRGVIYIKKAKQ